MRTVDHTGLKYGRLTAIRFARQDGNVKYWLFRCDCGSLHTTPVNQVKHGGIKSCGCLHSEVTAEPRPGKHKMIKSPEYRVWASMLSRCRHKIENPRHGGRGIIVCERWMDFANFYADMGARPSSSHSIDRKDNDGNYEPRNCRWATPKEQAINRHNSIFVNVSGKQMPLADAAVALGVNYRTLYWRFKNNRPLGGQII